MYVCGSNAKADLKKRFSQVLGILLYEQAYFSSLRGELIIFPISLFKKISVSHTYPSVFLPNCNLKIHLYSILKPLPWHGRMRSYHTQTCNK